MVDEATEETTPTEDPSQIAPGIALALAPQPETDDSSRRRRRGGHLGLDRRHRERLCVCAPQAAMILPQTLFRG